jgi:inorganic pyrophosphatase
MGYWDSLEELVNNNGITIDRKKGTHHPKYSNIVYVADYGYINDSKSMDGNGIDVFVGTDLDKRINGIICTIDRLKNDLEIKVLIGCTKQDVEEILGQLNNSEYMKAMYIERK